MLPPNTILRERYRIISELGHGGMGTVYQAMDENLNCIVAVKETFARTEEHRRAFRREAELLANLSHPTLPRVMDHFTHGEGQFLVMQFLSGHDLAELLELREQPFAVDKVLGWADQLLDALEELHSYDPPIVHRDIKPSNLKVTPKGRILLLDFGLAKGAAGQMSTADADSRPKSIYGYTPNYAPLEQIRGAGTDPRSDLYSLAATVWTLLTGKVPPDALSRVGEKEEGKPDPLRPAHELNQQVPLFVSDALSRAMSLNRNQRYASAAEMRRVLRNVPQAEGERLAPQTVPQNPSGQVSVPVAPGSLSETVKIAGPPTGGSTGPHQAAQTMPGPKPPNIPSREQQAIASTVASLPPKAGSQQSKSENNIAIIGAGVVVLGAGLAIVAIVTIALAIWRPWAKNTNLSNNPSNTSSARGPKTLADQIGVDMVWIRPGSFLMGGGDYRPVHFVSFSEGFYLGKYEVTQSQWQAVMGNNPSKFKACGGNCPIEQVSWSDAQEFIKKLNAQTSNYTYRLPTEAEWEYACRAGTTSDYYGPVNDIGWYGTNSGGTTRPIGLKQPNAFGLYDMSGNVWELTADLVHFTYEGAPTDGRAWLGDTIAKSHVIRGGAYFNTPEYLTSARRGWRDPSMPDTPGDHVGFRMAATSRTQR
jgi:formylglycine-generating enzyme required for sulfatase activity/predicted Ser/Thr protein kinase